MVIRTLRAKAETALFVPFFSVLAALPERLSEALLGCCRSGFTKVVSGVFAFVLALVSAARSALACCISAGPEVAFTQLTLPLERVKGNGLASVCGSVRTLVLDVTARDRNLRSSLVFRPAKTMARYCGKIVRALPLHDAICPGEVLGQPLYCTPFSAARYGPRGKANQNQYCQCRMLFLYIYIYISLSLMPLKRKGSGCLCMTLSAHREECSCGPLVSFLVTPYINYLHNLHVEYNQSTLYKQMIFHHCPVYLLPEGICNLSSLTP